MVDVVHKEILIVAGGTGGHIMPAIAIGEALKRLAPDMPVSYICGSKPLEYEIYHRFGITPIRLAVVPLYRRIPARLKGFVRLIGSFIQSLRLVKSRGGVILGMGSYVSAPVLAAARMLRVPYFIHEQNSIPGKTNRYFARHARGVFSSFPITGERMERDDMRMVGIPVRSSILEANREEAIHFFGIDSSEAVALILGGSQGARDLNRILCDWAPVMDRLLEKAGKRLQVIWSAGQSNQLWIREEIEKTEMRNLDLKIYPFITRMELAYAVADIAICRAGAATLAELAVRGVPGIIIPLPHAMDNHQYYNARHYSDSGAGILIEQSSLSPDNLAEEVMNLLSTPQKLKSMHEIAERIALPGASEQIAELLIQEICASYQSEKGMQYA